MQKIINPCFVGNAYREMFIKISYEDNRLSITGVIEPSSNGFEEVPEDIINFLFSLPETKKDPAWV